MGKQFRRGDRIGWNGHGGEAPGKVVQTISGPVQIKRHKVSPSKDNPGFIVEAAEGRRAAHTAGALKRQ